MGVSRMTKEHIGITMALKLPMFVVVTKIDLAPENVYQDTMNTLNKILKGSACQMKPILVKDSKSVESLAQKLYLRSMCPIFPVSNVSGQGIDILKKFIACLPSIQIEDESDITPSSQWDELVETEFILDSRYNVKNVGLVVGGTVTRGSISLNQTLMLGPDKNGQFKTIMVKGIQENRVDILHAGKGATVTLAIKSVNKKDQNVKQSSFKKGMVLLGLNTKNLKKTNPT